MDSMPSSGYLAENIPHLLGLSADAYAMTVYGKTTTRGGDLAHAEVHDAIRSLLLVSKEPEITVHIGKTSYAAGKIGDDQWVICWRTGADFAKSKGRAIRRAVGRKKPVPAPVPSRAVEAVA